MSGDKQDEIAAARLRRALAEQEADHPTRGRLIENDEVVRALSRPLPRLAPTARPRSDRGVSFHFALTHVGSARDRDPAALPPDRVWAFPNRHEVKTVRALGGQYNRQHQAWSVPPANALAAARFRTPQAQARWARGGGKGARGPAAAADFQRYIERADLEEAERQSQVVHDEQGAVSFGNLGSDMEERSRFWHAYAAAANRANARLQSRIIVEVPHELAYMPDGPTRVRALAQAIVAPLAERRLPYHVTAHWPEVDKGTDSRNVHLHVVYGERVTDRAGYGSWRIGPPDRSARGDGAGGGAWAAGLRDRYAAALNDALTGIGASKRYDPRSYAESGIITAPGRHAGPARCRLQHRTVEQAAGPVEPEYIATQSPAPALQADKEPAPPHQHAVFLVGAGALAPADARRDARRLSTKALSFRLRMTREALAGTTDAAIADQARQGISILAAVLRARRQQLQR